MGFFTINDAGDLLLFSDLGAALASNPALLFGPQQGALPIPANFNASMAYGAPAMPVVIKDKAISGMQGGPSFVLINVTDVPNYPRMGGMAVPIAVSTGQSQGNIAIPVYVVAQEDIPTGDTSLAFDAEANSMYVPLVFEDWEI